MRADGHALHDASGAVVAMAATPELAARIERAMASAGQYEAGLTELLVACGLDYARDWPAHEAFAEVARQIRMVRKTFPNARASLSA